MAGIPKLFGTWEIKTGIRLPTCFLGVAKSLEWGEMLISVESLTCWWLEKKVSLSLNMLLLTCQTYCYWDCYLFVCKYSGKNLNTFYQQLSWYLFEHVITKVKIYFFVPELFHVAFLTFCYLPLTSFLFCVSVWNIHIWILEKSLWVY